MLWLFCQNCICPWCWKVPVEVLIIVWVGDWWMLIQRLKWLLCHIKLSIEMKVWRFFSKTELKFVERQAFTSFKHGFFQVWGKLLTPIISNTKWCHSVGLSCNFIRTCLFCFDWQMLLPLFVYQHLADVIAICFICGWYRTTCFVFIGRCYCLMLYVTDVIVTFNVLWWLMLLSLVCDWCYYHILLLFVDWQMLCHVVWHHFTIARGHWTCPWLMLLPFFVLLGWCYCHLF